MAKQRALMHGIHTVQAALEHDPSKITQVWLERQSRNQRVQRLVADLEKQGLRPQWVDTKTLDRLVGNPKAHIRHQGIVVEYRGQTAWGEHELYALLDKLEAKNETPFLLILDGVTDPHNLGACLRTADGAGVHAVIAPKDKAVGLTPAVRKVASGAVEWVPFAQVTNLARTLEQLKSRGIWLVGTSDKAEEDLYQRELTGALGLVMGAEGKGLRRLTEKHCDFLVALPMKGQVSSLNVSVATGVVLYEALRQRS